MTAAYNTARGARYEARKLAGVCLDCGAGLTDEDGAWCVEHTESRRLSAEKYRRSRKGRRRDRAQQKLIYARKVAAGRCVYGGCRAQAAVGQRRCQFHREEHSITNGGYVERRRQGVSLVKAPKRAATVECVVDIPRVSLRDRILGAVRRGAHEIAEIHEALGASTHTERNTVLQGLKRASGAGLLTRTPLGKGPTAGNLYHLAAPVAAVTRKAS